MAAAARRNDNVISSYRNARVGAAGRDSRDGLCRSNNAGHGLCGCQECQPETPRSIQAGIDGAWLRRRKKHTHRIPRGCPGCRIPRRGGRIAQPEGRHHSRCECGGHGRSRQGHKLGANRVLAVFDPVGIGVVKSLERPGTNVTGTTMYASRLIGERLRILKRIVPDLDKVAMALNGNNVNNAAQFELLRLEGRKLGVEAQSLDIRKPEDVDAAFDKALAFGAKALLNAVDTFINSRRFALAAGAAKHKLPFVYSDVEYVLAGGLMALGPGHYEGYFGAAKYVDQILR